MQVRQLQGDFFAAFLNGREFATDASDAPRPGRTAFSPGRRIAWAVVVEDFDSFEAASALQAGALPQSGVEFEGLPLLESTGSGS